MKPSWIAAINPEFARHIWLEMSPHRVIGLPVVIILICLMSLTLDHGIHALTTPAMSIAVILLLWGTHLAAESILSEVREQTWHAQRMSALSPWQLVWGKLFGSTLFAWYGALLCLLLYVFAVPETMKPSETTAIVLFVVLAGIACHAATMLLCLTSVPRTMAKGRIQSFSYVLLMLLCLLPWLTVAMFDLSSNVDWYHRAIPKTLFINFSIALLMGWALAGLYRVMRRELQMQQGFAVWLGFECCLIAYSGGFTFDAVRASLNSQVEAFFIQGIFIATLLTYAMLFLEDFSPIDAKQMLAAWGRKAYRELMQLIPCWLVSLVLTMLLLLGFALNLAGSEELNMLYFVAAIVLFTVRDGAILLWVRFRPGYKQANTVAIVIYLLCSYSILPGLLKASDMALAIPLFFPLPDGGVMNLLVAIEAALAVFLMVDRWQRVSLPDEA